MEGLVRGDYRVIREVGSGGMGTVYLAVHKDVPELKVIFKKLADSALFDRFKDEANSMAILEKHPNICRIRDFFEDKDGTGTVLAMEYIDGPTVNEMLSEKGKLTVDESLRIAIDVLDALEFAHSKSIHHRDIKPGNVMVESSDGRVKVIDFGIAKAMESLRSQQTIAGHFVGTPEYMAPEQFGHGQDINWALADVYACGVMLYYMLTGQQPFKSNQIYQLLNAKVNERPDRPSKLVKEVPKQLDVVLLACLEADPEKRPQSAGEFRSQLVAIRQSLHAAPSSPGAQGARKPRGKMIVGVLSALAVVAVLAVIFGTDLQLPTVGTESGGEQRQLPGEITLLDPRDGFSTEDSRGLVLIWSKADDDGVVYDLEVAPNFEFKGTRRVEGLERSQWDVPSEFEAGTYYWRVRARSDAGAAEFSPAWSFTITEPSVKEPVARENESAEDRATIALGAIEITVNEPSTMSIDDSVVARGSRSYSGEVAMGSRRVTVSSPTSQEKTLTQQAIVTADEPAEIAFTFTPALTGVLTIISDPAGADVFVNGRLVPGKKTPTTIDLPAGEHRIGAGMEGNVREATVTVRAGEETRQTFTLVRGSRDEYLSVRSEYENLLKSIPSDERTGAAYSDATSLARQAASAADERNFIDAVSGLQRARISLQQSIDGRRSDSVAVEQVVSSYWHALETGQVDSMQALYPSGDHESWKQFVGNSRQIKVSNDFESTRLSRADQTATVRMHLVLDYTDNRGRTNNATNTWDVELVRDGERWVIRSMQVR